MNSFLKRVRVRQIQFCSAVFRRMGASRSGTAFVKALRAAPVVRGLLNILVGYNRPFATLKDAAAAITGYEGGGHSNPSYLTVKVPEAEKPRPGDYAALFHLAQLTSSIHSIFDVGGSVGNLFYCYSSYLNFSPDLRWTVFDLPDTNKLGRELAEANREARLHFTDRMDDADGADVLISSGSLHYFEQKLSDMIRAFAMRPRYLIINRAPLVNVPSFATVQDGGTYRLPCFLHNRKHLVDGLQDLGYELVDSWEIPERSVIVPCYPDWSARAYTGLFFRLKMGERATSERIPGQRAE
jgi:putative methyltransferase (TIGR04325 family)